MQNIWHSFAIPIYCITNVKHMFYILYAMQMLYGSYALYIIICLYRNYRLEQKVPHSQKSITDRPFPWLLPQAH